MLIVRFDMEQTNFLIAGKDTYFLLMGEAGQRMLVNGQCAHRGGPLHLACLDRAHHTLICPWHETRIGVRKLIESAIPMIRVDEQATALLPVPSETETQLMRRRIGLPPLPIGAISATDALASPHTV